MHRSSNFARTSFAFAIAGAIGLCATPALADIPLSLDLDYVLPVDAGPVDDGFGGALRFGPRVDLKLLTLAGEASLGIHDFSGPEGPTVYRGVVGGRFGLGYLLRPSIFGHLGVGHADWSSTEDLTHLTLDIGASLDVTVVPAFEIGVHAAYNYLAGNGSVDDLGFMTLGGHLTFVLDPNDDDGIDDD